MRVSSGFGIRGEQRGDRRGEPPSNRHAHHRHIGSCFLHRVELTSTYEGHRHEVASRLPRVPPPAHPRLRSLEAPRRGGLRPLALVVGLLLFVSGCGPGAGDSDSAPAPRGDSEPEPVATWERQRPEFAAIARRLTESHNPYLGTAQLTDLERRLSAPDLGSLGRSQLLWQLSFELLRCGRVDEALRAIHDSLDAWAVAGSPAQHAATLYSQQALVQLRRAEIENCVRRHNAECCLLPLRGAGVHSEREPAEAAAAALEAWAAHQPARLDVRWLRNLVAMALGEYPEGLDADVFIPTDTFASEVDVGRFVDVAPDLGVATFNHCGGVVVEDFDGDRQLDIVTSSFAPSAPLTFYAGGPGLSFEDASEASRANDQLGGLNLVGGDYDDDGDVDVLVLRGAWLFDDGQIRNSLLQNDGDGVFVDVTRAAGLAEPAAPSQAACWGDFDLDGDLDLYVGNESRLENTPAGTSYPSQLFINGGDGTFVDRARDAGVTNDRYTKGVTAGDYDDDGDLDLYVSNLEANRLYRNEGGLTFSDVAPALRVDEPRGRSFATWFFDYDNDGKLDIFVGAFAATIASVAADHLGQVDPALRPRLYRNVGDGGFQEATYAVGLVHAWAPMGANFGDLDNDGWLDIYLATGDPGYQTLMPNVMLRNDRGERFEDVTQSGGFGHLQKGHGVAFADFDDDGDQDVYNQLGGFYPGDAFHNALFRNPGHGRRFLHIRLVGTETNHFGLGARITVTFMEGGKERRVHRAVGSVSSFGGSPLRQEIGLGDATEIVEVAIDWPVSGARQILQDVPLDTQILVTEGDDSYQELPLR